MPSELTCFKSYEYIETAYNSIKSQSLIDWEWVIMDDTPEDDLSPEETEEARIKEAASK